MVYDDTKLNAAFSAWLIGNVDIGFGDVYVGDLLADFCDFLAETKMLKRSPGRVKFGQMLRKHGGFDRHKNLGLTYWAGLELKKPRTSKPKRYDKTKHADEAEDRERKDLLSQREGDDPSIGRQERLDKFHAEMAEEDKLREDLENVED